MDSMAETAQPPSPPMGLVPRLLGVVFAPYKAYAAVAQRPRWFGALAVTIVIVAAAQGWLLSNEAIQQATLDQQVRMIEGFGANVTDEMYAGMERSISQAQYTTAASIVFILPIANAILAGIVLGIFNAIMGGNATFRQAFAIVVHSGVISAVAQLISAPINYVREQVSSPLRLNALVPMFDEETFVGMLLGSIDLLIIWWLVSLAIGVGVLYKRRTGPIMTSFIGLYLGLVLIVTGIRLAL